MSLKEQQTVRPSIPQDPEALREAKSIQETPENTTYPDETPEIPVKPEDSVHTGRKQEAKPLQETIHISHSKPSADGAGRSVSRVPTAADPPLPKEEAPDQGRERSASTERFNPQRISAEEPMPPRQLPLQERAISGENRTSAANHSFNEPVPVRKEPSPLHGESDTEAGGKEIRSVEQRESVPLAPRSEIKRVELKLESAHMRFLLQKENLQVEIMMRERIENHLSYMDAQRLYRNLQTLGVNLEVFRINGVDLSPRPPKTGRRDDRGRDNIGVNGDPDQKASNSPRNSADLSLFL